MTGGSGNNTLAYTIDGGTTWIGLGNSIFNFQTNNVINQTKYLFFFNIIPVL